MEDQKLKRQKRFIQKSRFKKRVFSLLIYNASYASPATVGKLYHTRARCSCPMCGNSRKYFGEVTIQEKSLEQLFKNTNWDE